MAVQRTRWRPDTCGCVLEYEWDDAQPAELRTHTPVVARACRHHQVGATADVFKTCADENTLKNRVMNKILEDPSFGVDVVNGEGELVREFQQGAEPTFRYDEKRSLIVSLPATKKIEALVIKSGLSKEFGAGKIEVE